MKSIKLREQAGAGQRVVQRVVRAVGRAMFLCNPVRSDTVHRRTQAVADTCSKSLLRGNSHYGGAIRGESMCIRCVRGPYYEYHGRGYAVLPGVDIRCHAY